MPRRYKKISKSYKGMGKKAYMAWVRSHRRK